MATELMQDFQRGDGRNTQTPAEHTRPGPVYTPPVDIFENDTEITVLADMPGVKAENLKVDLRDSILTLTGHLPAVEQAKESELLREYFPGTFFRQFTLSETIDQGKIVAKLSDGVLRLELPKVEKARPREITVKAS